MFVIVYNLACKNYIICCQEDNHIEHYMNKIQLIHHDMTELILISSSLANVLCTSSGLIKLKSNRLITLLLEILKLFPWKYEYDKFPLIQANENGYSIYTLTIFVYFSYIGDCQRVPGENHRKLLTNFKC
jgi:hypothetical protein